MIRIFQETGPDSANSTCLTTSVRRLSPPTRSTGSAPSTTTGDEEVDDLGGNETHDEPLAG